MSLVVNLSCLFDGPYHKKKERKKHLFFLGVSMINFYFGCTNVIQVQPTLLHSDFEMTVIIGQWAGRGANGSCILFNKRIHHKLFGWLEQIRKTNAVQLINLVRSSHFYSHCIEIL